MVASRQSGPEKRQGLTANSLLGSALPSAVDQMLMHGGTLHDGNQTRSTMKHRRLGTPFQADGGTFLTRLSPVTWPGPWALPRTCGSREPLAPAAASLSNRQR